MMAFSLVAEKESQELRGETTVEERSSCEVD